MYLWLGLSLAFVIGLVHFFGEEIDERTSVSSLFFASFSAGFTIAYFFLALLPEISTVSVQGLEFVFVLAGFSFFYIVEELIYERSSHITEIKKEFKELHTLFITGYHFCIGIILLFLLNQDLTQALLFFVPVLVHTAVNSLAIREMHEEILDNLAIKILASFSTVLGVGFAHLFSIPSEASFALLGVIGGMFVYLVIHDSLDPQKERPLGFFLGVLAFGLLLALL